MESQCENQCESQLAPEEQSWAQTSSNGRTAILARCNGQEEAEQLERA